MPTDKVPNDLEMIDYNLDDSSSDHSTANNVHQILHQSKQYNSDTYTAVETSHRRPSILEESDVELSNSDLDYSDPDTSDDDTQEKTINYPEGGKIAYLTLFGSFTGLIAEFGLWNSTGAIESYVSNHILDGKANEVAIAMIFSLFSFFTMGGSMISGILFDKYGAKVLCWPGGLMVVGGLMATANCTELYQFILALGLCCGMGCALLTSPLVTCIGHYFQKKRGMALAIAMPGASLGGVIWPQVCRILYVKVGFPWTMRVLGFCMLGLLIISCICVHDRHDEIMKIKRENEGDRGELTIKEKVNEILDFNSLKDVTFMSLTAALFMNEFSLIMISTYIPSYALSKGYSESLSLTALTVTNAAGVLGRIIPTYLSDRYGKFNSICVMSLTMTLSVFILLLPLGKYLGTFMAFCIIFGFSVAGTLALTPLCTSAISKPKDFGRRYGTAYFFVAFCNLISLPIGMALTKTSAGYDAMAGFAGATCALATLCFTYTRYRVGGIKRIAI